MNRWPLVLSTGNRSGTLQNFLGLGRDFGPFPVPVTVQ